MGDNSARGMKSSSDTNDLDPQDQRTRRARGSSATFRDGNLIDLSNGKKQNTMESTQEDVEYSSSDDAPASKEKPSLSSQVTGLLPFGRSSSQRPQTVIAKQHVKSRRELDEDILTLQKTCARLRNERRDFMIKNERLLSTLDDAREEHDTREAAAQLEIERLETSVKSARTFNARAQRSLEVAGDKIVRLQLELDTVNEKFQTAEIAAADEISLLTSERDAAKQELLEETRSSLKESAQLQSRIKLLTEKNDKFREMLIPVSEKQVLDAEVVQKFRSLRSSIVRLARQTWTLEFRPDVDINSLPKGHQEFFLSSIPASYDRLRFVVFAFLYHGIFDSKNYFLQDGFDNFEEHLREVETGLSLNSPVENRTLVLEWRNASFKVTETFRGDGYRLSRAIQSQISNFLGPLKMMDNLAVEAKAKKLEEVCEAAIDLSFTIRQLKDNFWVDNMVNAVDQPISLWDQFTEEMATVPAGDGKEPGTIAFVIAGALIKNPKEDMEKVLVFEKAEVAVYR